MPTGRHTTRIQRNRCSLPMSMESWSLTNAQVLTPSKLSIHFDSIHTWIIPSFFLLRFQQLHTGVVGEAQGIHWAINSPWQESCMCGDVVHCKWAENWQIPSRFLFWVSAHRVYWNLIPNTFELTFTFNYFDCSNAERWQISQNHWIRIVRSLLPSLFHPTMTKR